MTTMRPGPTVRARVRVIDLSAAQDVIRRDDVATEEPLQIRLAAGDDRATVATTMRTPGHDFELAAGWLSGEGIIATTTDLERVDYCTDIDLPAEQHFNVVTATLRSAALPELDRLDRHGFVTSACGVCGKAEIDRLGMRLAPLADAPHLPVRTLLRLPELLRERQLVFARTGGLHAAGLADLGGALVLVREDVGRHNAVDKVVGHQLLAGRPAGELPLLVVSGRTSFEIVQKAAAARTPFVVGVSAPSSLAIELAERTGVTLIGFTRGDRANIYTHADRVLA
jgi:FdhD protein